MRIRIQDPGPKVNAIQPDPDPKPWPLAGVPASVGGSGTFWTGFGPRSDRPSQMVTALDLDPINNKNFIQLPSEHISEQNINKSQLHDVLIEHKLKALNPGWLEIILESK
jgi:hypothetical protein